MSGSDPATGRAVEQAPGRERALFGLAAALWVVALLLALVASLIGVRYPDSFAGVLPPSVTTWMYVTVGLVGLGYATAGLLILRHRVRHVVGWLLLVTGPALVAVFVSAGIGLTLHEQGDPLGVWLALVATLAWWPAILLVGPALALLFPDGRLPGPRWRLPIGLSLVVLLVSIAILAVQPRELAGGGGPTNPLAIAGLPAWIFELGALLGNVIIFAQVLLGAAAVILRFRRSRGDERQQMKWFASAVVTWVAVFVASWFIEWDAIAVVELAALLLIPAAVVVAITRYRLYEIDRLINRTLVYVPLVGIVAGLYAALVLFFGRLLTAVTGDTSDVAAIISALILAAVFTPIRKSVESTVDRYFKPSPEATGSEDQAPASGRVWDDPEFAAAVERIARGVVSAYVGGEPLGGGGPEPATSVRSEAPVALSSAAELEVRSPGADDAPSTADGADSGIDRRDQVEAEDRRSLGGGSARARAAGG